MYTAEQIKPKRYPDEKPKEAGLYFVHLPDDDEWVKWQYETNTSDFLFTSHNHHWQCVDYFIPVRLDREENEMEKNVFDTQDLRVKIENDNTIIRQNANAAFANAEWFRVKIDNIDMLAIAKSWLDLQGYFTVNLKDADELQEYCENLLKSRGYDVVKRKPEIKACPICGDRDVRIASEEGHITKWLFVICYNCMIRTDGYFSEEAAIEAWNALPREEGE